MRGMLRVESRQGYGWDSTGHSLRADLTIQEEAVAALPTVDQCPVTKITDRGALIVGVEDVGIGGRQ